MDYSSRANSVAGSGDMIRFIDFLDQLSKKTKSNGNSGKLQKHLPIFQMPLIRCYKSKTCLKILHHM